MAEFHALNRKTVVWMLVFVLLCGVFTVLALRSHEQNVAVYQEAAKRAWVSHYESALLHHRRLAGLVSEEVLQNPIVPYALRRALVDSAEERAAARSALWEAMRDFYERIREHGLKQLHFHLPDSESFLRMHQPDRFGDSLLEVRPSVRLANESLRPVEAFEEGRVFNGYRHVFPVFDGETHVGTVEVSFSTSSFRDYMAAAFRGEYEFAIRSEVMAGIVFQDLQSQYRPCEFLDGYVVENSDFVRPKRFFAQVPEAERPVVVEAMRRRLLEVRGEVGVSVCTFESLGRYWDVCLMPITNLKGEEVALLFSVAENQVFRRLEQDMYVALFVVWVLFFLVVGLLYFFSRTEKVRLRLHGEMTDRLEKIARNVPGMVYQFQYWPDSGRMCFPYASRNIRDLYRVGPEEAAQDGACMIAALHPEDRERVMEQVMESARTLSRWASQYRVRFPNGDQEWHEGEAVPERLADGSVLWHGFIFKVTARKEVERQLETQRAELKRLALVAERTGNGVAIADTEGLVEWVNAGFTRITGYTLAEIRGKKPGSVLQGPASDSETICRMGMAVRQRRPFSEEIINYNKEGTPYWVHIECQPLYDEAGVFSGFTAVQANITARKAAEAALKSSEQRFRDIAEASGEYIWEVDSEGAYTYATGRIESLLGRPISEILGQTPFAFMHPDDQPRVRQSFERVSLAREPFRDMEHRSLRPDGSVVWQRVSGLPIVDASGKLLGYRGTADDITGRKAAEQQIKEAKERLEIATRAGGIGIWDYNIADNALLWDERMFAIYGIRREQFHSTFEDWRRTVHPEDLSLTEAHFMAAIKERKDFDVEFRILWPNGEIRHIAGTAMVLRDERGHPFRVIGVNSDITERKRMEEKLADGQKRLAYIIEGTNAGTWEWHVQTGQTVFNERWAEMVGYTLKELEPVSIETWTRLAHPEDLQKSAELLGRHFCGELPYYESEARMRHKDGHWVWVLDRGCVATWSAEGKPLIMSGTHQDITERKRMELELRQAMETAESANRAKSAFLATMSHEIRTPLNAVIGMSSLLLDSDLNADQADYAETIVSSGEALLGLINDILDYSKIEAGRVDLEEAPFDLSDAVVGALEMVAQKASQKGLELTYFIDAHSPSTIVGDSARLRQVLLNLLSNAVKFTDAGEVSLQVYTLQEGGDSISLTFKVTDTGIGMDEASLDKLFKPFVQADSSVTRRFGGTGLGLAICKRLVELMGGTIGVSSVVGQGSTFTFNIRVRAGALSERVYHRGGEVRLEKKSVLVVDDNVNNRRMLELQLQAWGMYVTVCKSGGEALEHLRRGIACDIVLLDYHMPEMDGLSVARALRASSVRADLPLVLLSSSMVDEVGESRSKFAAVLVKPLKPAALEQVLREVLLKSGQVPLVHATRHPFKIHVLSDKLPLRVLLAEDTKLNRKVMLVMLARMGYAAKAVENGQEVLDELEKNRYDLVLLDVQMPVMDGLTAARRIRLRWGAYPGGPRLVALTANAMHGDREVCLEAGMDEYLSKPLKPAQLEQCLVTLFAGRIGGASEAETSREDCPLFDLSFFREMTESFPPEEALVTLGEFREEWVLMWQQVLPEIRESCLAREEQRLRASVHKLVGSAGSMGFRRLSRYCAEVQAAFKGGHFKDWEGLPLALDTLGADSLEAFDLAIRNW